MKLYEGLFLIDAGRASNDWAGTESRICSMLEKHGCEIKEKIRYDERKLAYPVKGFRRGTYFLVYFDADPQSIQEINADLNLTDAALRSMIIRVESGEIPEYDPTGAGDPMGRRHVEPTPVEKKPEEAPAEEEKPAPEETAEAKKEEEKPAEEPEKAAAGAEKTKEGAAGDED